jgi:hypothetical protein
MIAPASTGFLACAGVALTLGAVGSGTSLATSFAPARTYVAGSSLAYVTVGDLNGDHKPDLVAANDDDDTVSVRVNRGGGRFWPRRAYRTDFGPVSVAIGDLNGDHKPDIATANIASDDNVSVLLNNGDGSFAKRRDYHTGAGPQSVAMGDLNGDARPDLVVENGDKPSGISVLLNNGDGTFQPRVDYPIGDFGLGSVAVADLNDDGKADVAAVIGPRGSVAVFLNNGDGTLRPETDYATGHPPLFVAIGDLNGDGSPDLATANLVKVGGAGTVSVLLNRGDGGFAARREYVTGREPQSVAVGDLNRDGKADLATSNWYDSVSVLVNAGRGSFPSARTFASGPDPVSVAIGDVNADGGQDLVVGDSGQDPYIVSVLLNATGRCGVPRVLRTTLRAARRAIARSHCRVGAIRHSFSRVVETRHVISQQPSPGNVLPKGGKVNLVVSKGPRR